MLPAWLLRAAPYIAGAAVLVAAVVGVYSAGYSRAADRYKAEIAATAQRHAEAVAAAERRARTAEQAVADTNAEQDAKRHKVEADAKSRIDQLRADLRAANKRLSIPAKCPAIAGADPGAAGGPGAETRAEILPGTADDLVRIAGECDAVVRERNALIDRYNTVRDAYNALVK